MKTSLLLLLVTVTISTYAQRNIHEAIQQLSEDQIAVIKNSFEVSQEKMNEIWLQLSKQPFKTAPNAAERLDSSYTSGWDQYSLSWAQGTQRSIYTYNSKGLVTVNLVKVPNNNVWSIQQQQVLTYDASNNMISSSRQFYAEGTWFEIAKRNLTYDANGLLISSTDLALDYNTYLLVNKSKMTITYDDNHHLVKMLSEEWENNAWVQKYEAISTFDNNNNMTEWAYFFWNSGEVSYGARDIATYNSNHDITSFISQTWEPTSKTWSNNYQLVNFVLDNNGNGTLLWQSQSTIEYLKQQPMFMSNGLAFSSYTRQVWVDNAWVDNTNYTSVFDSNNHIISASNKSWSKGAWKDYINWTFTYDANMHLTNTTDETWNVIYWIKRRTNYIYDANRNETSKINETFLGNGGDYDWVKSNTTFTTYTSSNAVISKSNRNYPPDGKMITISGDSIYNYYGDGSSGVQQINVKANEIAVFPNPTTGKFNIHSTDNTITSIAI